MKTANVFYQCDPGKLFLHDVATEFFMNTPTANSVFMNTNAAFFFLNTVTVMAQSV
jgi:hypothetical protein